MSDCVATVEIDEHWDACSSCRFYTDLCKCQHGISSLDDARIESWGEEYTCTLYEKGQWVNPDIAKMAALASGFVIDHPAQAFLFDGVRPATTADAVEFASKNGLIEDDDDS